MSLLNQKAFGKISTGKHTIIFKEITEIAENKITKTDAYIKIQGTLENGQEVTDIRFDSGLKKLTFQLINTHYQGQKDLSHADVLMGLVGKEIPVWVSYTNSPNGKTYTNYNYEEIKETQEKEIGIDNLKM